MEFISVLIEKIRTHISKINKTPPAPSAFTIFTIDRNEATQ
jgi:hypothetical protein